MASAIQRNSRGKRSAGKRSTRRPPAQGGAARINAHEAAIARLDNAPDRVVLEFDAGAVELANLRKVLWPAAPDSGFAEYTRRDYLRYLLRAAPYMLPHLRDRPLTLIRQPAGIHGRRFVHFHYEQPLPAYVETVSIYSEKARRAEQYLMCNNVPTLLWLAHVGSLEFHAWHSRATAPPDANDTSTEAAGSLEALERSTLNLPDYIVCDLDPYIYSGQEATGAQPEFNMAAWNRCKDVAFELKALLDPMRLQSLVKTSGKTGLHVLVPVVRTIPYSAARAFAETLGRHLMRVRPDTITMDQRVAKRTGKIFFDSGMNARVKTLISPYSARGVAGAPVAMPLEWAELERAKPLDYTIRNVPEILQTRGDLWGDILERKQDLQRVLARA
jgi:bifunctional non-homologous end joining protein LigD